MESRALCIAPPPLGHLVALERWRGSAVADSLQGAGVKVVFEKEMGVVDFLLPNRSCVLYISECDVIAGNAYKRKLVRFRHANSSSVPELVVVERSRLSEQYFPSLQRFVVFELGLTLLPAGDQREAAQLLSQMVHSAGRDNPFSRRSVSRLYEPQLLHLLQQIPGVGGVKASALLHSFPSLQELSHAGLPQLEALVGTACAQHIHSFLHKDLV